MRTVGDRLREAREKKNLKQTQVMARTGINNKTLSGYEKGVSEPDLDTLNILAELYEVSVDFLLGRTDKSKQVLSNDARRIIDSLDLSDEEIMKTLKLEVDGIQLTPEQVLQFVNYVRVERTMKQPAPVLDKGTT